jgi:RecA/RadA recombinase
MASIMDKLKKNSRTKTSSVLSKSIYYNEKDMTPTNVPMINVALSGSIDGGLTSGLTILAGPSKHFKTSFALLIAAAYLKQHDDAVLLFYDSEFGSPQSYFTSFGIDTDRVFHSPIANIEELKFDLVQQLDELDRGDKVIVVIDSIGNLASKKELDDALDEKSVADMTRAKHLKGLFRMVTPYLTLKNIPMLAINHTYQTMEMFSKAVVSGGTGIYYSADNIWILGRQQDKKGTEIVGYHFIINIDKSRFLKEKSKIPISVSWEGGVERWSGLLEVAVAGGFIHKGKKGQSLGYSYLDADGVVGEKVYYERETMNEEFWTPILKNEKFKEFIIKQYQIGHTSPVDPDSIVSEDEDVIE